MKKTIAFLSNKLTLRGTEIAMYDYADFNETLLNNKSIIITRDCNIIKNEMDVSFDAYNKFKNRFQVEYYKTREDIDKIVQQYNIQYLYIIKGGNNDGLYTKKCKNLIHCVFNSRQKHGEIYSVISSDVNKSSNTNYPVVPHMIRIAETNEDLRNELNIPKDAIVFARYGGLETFDISYVKKAIINVIENRKDIYFIFMNTHFFFKHPRIIYLPGTTDMIIKRKFINTSDALLHARTNGESFGLTCGEFAVCLKPIITCKISTSDNFHITTLKDKALFYSNYEEIYNLLINFNKSKYPNEYMINNGYLEFLPEKVMKIFENVYLNEKPLIYVNGFWSGFVDKTDANHIEFFENLFSNTKYFKNFEITNDINNANVLFESLFANSLVNKKKWLCKIHYSGESFSNPLNNYDIILYSKKSENTNKIIDCPLAIYYIYCNNFMNQLQIRNKSDIEKKITVPSKFCCFIVSNGKSNVRNNFFNTLNKYKKVDSLGNFNNNMGFILKHNYWTQEYRNFISQYKFIICFENTNFGTYITEKIVNPYLANIIPIYWGTQHIQKMFNPASMLYLENESLEAFDNLLHKIIELDNNDQKYLEYINQPVFTEDNLKFWSENYTIEKIANQIDNLIL